MKIFVHVFVAVCCILFFCNSYCLGIQVNGKSIQYKSIGDVPVSTWEQLAKKKIFFGHQSVGFDIMKGVTELMASNHNIKLHVSESMDISDNSSGIFFHSRIGKNFDPISKTKDFYNIITNKIGKTFDIAGFKFCFVDIQQENKNKIILKDYFHSIGEIEKQFPKLIVIHFTVPLMSIRLSWKDRVKKILGMAIDDNSFENIARNKYNKVLRAQLGNQELLFDLAKVESTYPDGSRCTFIRDGKSYFAMVPEYTYDGGHLTEIGRKRVAERFLLFLASII